MAEIQKSQDVVIIGGGAAGLTAGQYCARAGLTALVVEELGVGGQALVIEGLENYPGFPEPISGMEFAEKFEAQARKFGASFLYASVKSFTKTGSGFSVVTNKGEFSASAVILAMGAKHRHLGVPGEKELFGRGVSYCATCDWPFFKDKKILVVGGGDAACDEAQFLSRLTNQVVVIHRRDKFRAQKALAQRVLANPNIEVRFNMVMKEIKGMPGMGGKVSAVILAGTEDGKAETLLPEESAEGVFIFTGHIPQTSLLAGLDGGLKADLDESGYVITGEKMETSVPGLFAAGDVRTSPFRQIVTAAADGAVAARYASIYIDGLKGEAY